MYLFQMISVERVLEYTRLPSEAPLESTRDKRPPPDWPQNGEICLEHANLQYTPDGPVVLKDLTFTINAQEKVDDKTCTVVCIENNISTQNNFSLSCYNC